MKKLSISILAISLSLNLNAFNMIDTLKEYIQNKEEHKIIKLISTNPEVLDSKDSNGSSGFFLIAYSGLTIPFETAKTNKKSFDFHEAIVSGKIQIVNDSIANNPELVNTYSLDGFSPLSLAAFFDQTEIIELLLNNNSDPNLKATNPSKVNALHSAVAKENLKICELLLEFNVNVNSTQMSNVTALHSATHRGNLNLVKLLINNGADVNSKMDNGDTALTIAENEGHDEILLILEKANNNTQIKN